MAGIERQRAEAEAALQVRIAEAEESGADLRAQLEELQRNHAAALQQILDEAGEREALVREEARCKLDTKRAEELSEGADIDLLEALKSEFRGDRIRRLNQGPLGADIIHVVIHNGQECGSIVYGSKPHNVWRTEYITRLTQDQLAATAEHAILATHKFPAGVRQLHIQDGVIVANPARVISLVQLVRQHIVQAHVARMSAAERAEKTGALYDFMTLERGLQLLERIDTQAQAMLDLQEKEIRAHKATWARQGELTDRSKR